MVWVGLVLYASEIRYGPCFHIKMPSYKYRDSHFKDKLAIRPSLCPWTFRNIGFNMVPFDLFMSHLATQLGYSVGEFQALQLIVFVAFGLVSWINHWPPACWSNFWKLIFKQQLRCRFDKMDSLSSFFCILTYAIIYVFIHHIIFRLYLYVLLDHIIMEPSCT